MRLLCAIVLTFCLTASPAYAEHGKKGEPAIGIMCDTREQVERLIALEMEPQVAMAIVNIEANKENACIYGLALVRLGDTVSVVRNKKGVFYHIVQLWIVGVPTRLPNIYLHIPPMECYGIRPVEEHGI